MVCNYLCALYNFPLLSSSFQRLKQIAEAVISSDKCAQPLIHVILPVAPMYMLSHLQQFANIKTHQHGLCLLHLERNIQNMWKRHFRMTILPQRPSDPKSTLSESNAFDRDPP